MNPRDCSLCDAFLDDDIYGFIQKHDQDLAKILESADTFEWAKESRKRFCDVIAAYDKNHKKRG